MNQAVAMAEQEYATAAATQLIVVTGPTATGKTRLAVALARAFQFAPLKPEEEPLPKLSGDDPFRIVYTSGSTGEPPGGTVHE